MIYYIMIFIILLYFLEFEDIDNKWTNIRIHMIDMTEFISNKKYSEFNRTEFILNKRYSQFNRNLAYHYYITIKDSSYFVLRSLLRCI